VLEPVERETEAGFEPGPERNSIGSTFPRPSRAPAEAQRFRILPTTIDAS
jgi:hypothetical protein